MAVKVGINGFGRIGRLAFRAMCSKDIEVVGINDLVDAATLAHLLKYDSVHGRFPDEVSADGANLVVGGRRIPVSSERDPAKLPWKALGAKVAHPERQVYCIIGDGAMGFHPQELETAIRNDLNVVFLVLADRQWGMVKLSQGIAMDAATMLEKRSLPTERTINTDFSEICFDRLAESMGAHGERVSRAGDLRPAIERSLASGRCAVIHVDVDPVEHLWAPGLDVFKAMHQEPGE